jgi:cell surface protein SprA
VSDGIGYLHSMSTGQDMPSSPYNVMAVSLLEEFSPLIGVNSIFLNSMSLAVNYSTKHDVNLNIASYQIVEISSKTFGATLGYRIENFDKIIHFPKKTNPNLSNSLTVSATANYQMNQSLNRKIQNGFTQPTTGSSITTIKLTADYVLSRMIDLQAFFDKNINRPLVSSTAFPMSKSAFGISVKVKLMQ